MITENKQGIQRVQACTR